MKKTIFQDLLVIRKPRKLWMFFVISIVIHFVSLYTLTQIRFKPQPLPRRTGEDTQIAKQNLAREQMPMDTSGEPDGGYESFENADQPVDLTGDNLKKLQKEQQEKIKRAAAQRDREAQTGPTTADNKKPPVLTGREAVDLTKTPMPSTASSVKNSGTANNTVQSENRGGTPAQGAAPAVASGGRRGGGYAYTTRRRSNDVVDSDEYIQLYRKPFQDPRERPVSLFSLTVGRLSYPRVRRAIRKKQLPETEDVKIEELINYFYYDYPQPQGDELISIITEMAPCPWNPDNKLLHVGLKGKVVFGGGLKNSQFVLAKDVRIRVNFDAGKVRGYRLLGYGSRTPKVGGYRTSNWGSGEMRAGQQITALYEIIPVNPPQGQGETAFVKVDYKDADSLRPKQLLQPVLEAGAEPSENFKFSAAVAQFGIILKNPGALDKKQLKELLDTAKKAVGKDKYGYRKQFIEMVEKYKEINKK